MDIIVGEDGHVRKVDTTGGAVLGDRTMACIVQRIQQGMFEPPHGGGPLSLEVVADEET